MIFYLTIVVFVITYLFIISEKVHRTVISIFGAVLMILIGTITQKQAIDGVDFNTLGLLIGMMIVVSIASRSGIFQYVAIKVAKVAKGKPVPIMLLFGLMVAVFSAFLDNVTTVLLVVPMVFVVCNHLKVKPLPFLITVILLSNIGGAATLIGDPPNILIGGASGLSFNDFFINLAPVALIIGGVTLFLLYMIYRKDLTSSSSNNIMSFNPRDAIKDKTLIWKSLVVFALIMIGFMTHSITHLEGATITLGGAALLLLLTMHDPEPYLKEVEWPTIFFFIGLFILVSGLEHIGVIGFFADKIIYATQGNMGATAIMILWGSAICSAIIDNIPFVATMLPVIKEIGEVSTVSVAPLWWALALGADIGGNATLVGASANVIVSGMAEKEHHKISFFGYMKIAVPLTVIGLIIASLYIWFRYF